jgi:hypothetical protein
LRDLLRSGECGAAPLERPAARAGAWPFSGCKAFHAEGPAGAGTCLRIGRQASAVSLGMRPA